MRDNLKCVVFDFDGVLVDSNEAKCRAYFKVFDELGSQGATLVYRVLASGGERNRYGILRQIVREGRLAGLFNGTSAEDTLVSDYARHYNDICEEHAATCAEVLGAGRVLVHLTQRYPLYINSSTPDRPLVRIVSRRGWDGLFRGVYGSNHRKVENLARALRSEGVMPPEAVFVGDSEVDRSAAACTGLEFIGIRNHFNDFREAPSRLCNNMNEVEAAILKL